MKSIILLLPLILITSCAAYVRTLGTRMISPETHGALGKGAIDFRLQASKRDKLDFADNNTKNSVDRFDTPYALALQLDVGIFKQLDVFILPSLIFSPTIYGAKYQFIGSPRIEAKKGNFSASVTVGFGQTGTTEKSDSDLADILNANVTELEVNTDHQEVGLIAGYRWTDKLLHYVNTIYLNETVNGKVTSDDGVLNRSKYQYMQDGMIYSTGLIHYFAKAHWKLDYYHFVSDWTHTQKQTVNTVNVAIGFDW